MLVRDTPLVGSGWGPWCVFQLVGKSAIPNFACQLFRGLENIENLRASTLGWGLLSEAEQTMPFPLVSQLEVLAGALPFKMWTKRGMNCLPMMEHSRFKIGQVQLIMHSSRCQLPSSWLSLSLSSEEKGCTAGSTAS